MKDSETMQQNMPASRFWKLELIMQTEGNNECRTEQYLTIEENGEVFFAEYISDPLSLDPIELRKCRLTIGEYGAVRLIARMAHDVRNEETKEGDRKWKLTLFSRKDSHIVKTGKMGGISFKGDSTDFTKSYISDYLKWQIPVRGLAGFGI